jgi:hypothetical protein
MSYSRPTDGSEHQASERSLAEFIARLNRALLRWRRFIIIPSLF